MKGRGLLIFLIFFLFIFFCSQKTKAQTPPNQFHDIVINELMWMGSEKSTADEWIELYNNTDFNIDLTNWIIKYAATSRSDFLITSGTIKSKSYFLISNYGIGDKSILTIDPDIINAKVSLSNSEGFYQLLDQNQILIDEIGVDGEDNLSGINESGQKTSMERGDFLLDGTKQESWHSSTLQTNIISLISYATPGADNSIYIPPPPPKDYTNQIIFTEILANPAGSDSGNEYVKIKNLSPDIVDLTGWKIKDAANTNCRTLSESINPSQIIKISGLSCINNKTETLKIFDSDQKEITSLLYNHKISDDELYIFINGKWIWQMPPPEIRYKDYKKHNIKDLRKLPLESKVLIQGIVTVAPGNFSKYYFFIQDNSGGIKVYCKDKVILNVNDVILIYGYTHMVYNNIEVKFYKSNFIKLGRADHHVVLSDNSWANRDQGNLVKIKGRISKEGSKYYLNDEFGKIRVFFSSNAKIKKPKDFKYSFCEITGILNFYKDYFRIMPRNAEDIYVLKVLKPAKKSSKTLVQKILGVQTAYAASETNIILGKDYRNNSPPILISSSKSDFDYKLHIFAIILILASIFGIINLLGFSKIEI